MHHINMRRRAITLAAASLALSATAARAAFPDKPLKLAVGFPAGSGPDVVARAYGDALQQVLRQPVVVENRPGAGGQIAAQGVARAAADGYTLLLAEPGSMAIAPAAYSKLPYNPSRELRAVARVADYSFVLVSAADGPAHDLASFTARAKAPNARTNVATFGPGTLVHLGAQMIADAAGFKFEPLHYRTTGDAMAAIVTEDVQAALLSPALAIPHIKAGKMRALAVTSRERLASLPEARTLAEQGLPVEVAGWFVVFAPADTPAAVVERLSTGIIAASNNAGLRTRLESAGYHINALGADDTAAFVRKETSRWEAAVKASGFRGD